MAEPRAPTFHEPLLTGRGEGLDIIRGFWCIWVVVTHTARWALWSTAVPAWLIALTTATHQWFQHPEAAHPALIGFIVLSGYCIHRNGLRVDKIDVKPWFVRRFFRIEPLFLFACAAGAVGWTLAAAANQRLAVELTATTGLSVRSTLIQLSMMGAVYSPWHKASLQGNAPIATVMAEVWLYLSYPIVAWLRSRNVPSWLLGGAFMVWWTYTGWRVSHVAPPSDIPSWWSGGSSLYFAPFWWIGAIFIQPPRFPGPILTVAVLALTTWLLGSSTTQHWTVGAIRLLAMAVAYGYLLAWLDRRFATKEARFAWVFSPLASVGRAGYSIYALHAPLLTTLFILEWRWEATWVALFALGFLVHFTLERPADRFGANLARRLRRKAT